MAEFKFTSIRDRLKAKASEKNRNNRNLQNEHTEGNEELARIPMETIHSQKIVSRKEKHHAFTRHPENQQLAYKWQSIAYRPIDIKEIVSIEARRSVEADLQTGSRETALGAANRLLTNIQEKFGRELEEGILMGYGKAPNKKRVKDLMEEATARENRTPRVCVVRNDPRQESTRQEFNDSDLISYISEQSHDLINATPPIEDSIDEFLQEMLNESNFASQQENLDDSSEMQVNNLFTSNELPHQDIFSRHRLVFPEPDDDSSINNSFKSTLSQQLIQDNNDEPMDIEEDSYFIQVRSSTPIYNYDPAPLNFSIDNISDFPRGGNMNNLNYSNRHTHSNFSHVSGLSTITNSTENDPTPSLQIRTNHESPDSINPADLAQSSETSNFIRRSTRVRKYKKYFEYS
uniref:Uncharacterized protein n=1 Tax=Acrobeloides nanus TaxID=290746 RepID=A0A914DLH0_9BILA